MGRLPRLLGDELAYHALNRGNNREVVFGQPQDYLAFVAALGQTQQRYPFALFGYCLMPNHFHLLLRPAQGVTISRILQSLTVAHTWRFHRQHCSVGHVWQGRFKSPVIQDGDHLLVVLRYIEANPLRAGIVRDPADYRWSSYLAHGLGHLDPLLSGMPELQALGRTDKERQARWRAKVSAPMRAADVLSIRDSLRQGRPFGQAGWVDAQARALGVNLSPRPRGRPRKES